MSITDRIVEILCREFGDAYRGVISSDTIREDIEIWDSLSGVRLLLALEREFKARFSMDEAAAMVSVREIRDVIERKLS